MGVLDPLPTALPSWYTVTSPPLAGPPPSYANSMRTRCVPLVIVVSAAVAYSWMPSVL
jgi:hypothetical protein